MYKQKIEKYFEEHKDEILRDICTLIKIKSDKGEPKKDMPFGEGPAEALNVALNMANNMGFKTKNYDNYIGTVDFNDCEKQLDILAHLDVVPASNEWTITSPYNPKIKDGKLYGRGSADDKGPAIVALHALKAVKELGINLSKNVRLILGTDEECGSQDIDYYYSKEEEAPMTFSPDAEFPVINIEKGRLASDFSKKFSEDSRLPRICSLNSGVKANVVPDKSFAIIEGFELKEVEKYCKRFSEKVRVDFRCSEVDGNIKIVAKGKGAHASLPENGINALTALLELAVDLPCAHSEAFESLCNLNKLFPHDDHKAFGCGVNMRDDISGELSMAFTMFDFELTGFKGTFDSRAPICANDKNLTEKLKNNMAKFGIVLSDDKLNPAHHVSEESEFIRTLLNSYEKYTGLKGKCLAIGGGTYVHSLKNGVAFGCTMPGTDNNMHGDDEFAVINELITSAKIFTQVIIDLCK